MTQTCKNRSGGWVEKAVLKSNQELIKITVPSQEPEEHIKCYHHRSTALGLQIQDNSTSWPRSHLQDMNPTYSSIQDASHCYQMRERDQRPVHMAAVSHETAHMAAHGECFTLTNIKRYI